MITISGKYNYANVMIDEIDDETRNQIQNFVNNPSFKNSYIAIMPDCHAGSGSCIGFTMKMNNRIIPDVVGVDIGCGMLARKYDIDNIDVAKFDAYVKENVPSGFSVNNKKWKGEYFFRDTVERIGIDSERVLRSVGTLGGGNHYSELGIGQDGKLWVTIHTGSRNFGLKIANYHSAIAKHLCDVWGSECGGIPFLPVDSPEGQMYIHDQQIGVRFAKENRLEIIRRLEKFIGVDPVDEIESVHNFIDNTGMIRKGATSAHVGERLLIPFNMRDGVAICVGKGNNKFNCSAPHGAGRIMSRSKAKKVLDSDKFANQMKDAGVYTSTANASTLDEAPDAYKNMNTIIENIKDTVDIVDMVKPIYNFKAAEE